MSDIECLKYLKFALRMVGIISIFGFYPLTVFWPSPRGQHERPSAALLPRRARRLLSR